MIINMPDKARKIITVLKENGHEAYIVGGCVRDVILGREPGDWDITTSALPFCVKSLFRRTIDTGIEHGTVTVMMDKEGFEVTTYRIDGEYADGRHPDSVEFTGNLLEDLKRRDFTINAMAYNDDKGIVDAFGGLEDIKNCRIKCVGNPIDRFTEDALRMMRAVRFSAQLSFEIEEKTFEAICTLKENIKKVSKERIQVELTKTLVSKHPEYVEKYCATGLSRYILPVLDEHIENGTMENVKSMLNSVDATPELRYSVLFYDKEPKVAYDAMKSLKFDNKTINTVFGITKNFNIELINTPANVRRNLRDMGEELFVKLLMCRRAYFISIGAGTTIIDDVEKTLRDIIDRGDAYKISMLNISGKDLLEMGKEPGVVIGNILNELLDAVIEEPELNKLEILKSIVK